MSNINLLASKLLWAILSFKKIAHHYPVRVKRRPKTWTGDSRLLSREVNQSVQNTKMCQRFNSDDLRVGHDLDGTWDTPVHRIMLRTEIHSPGPTIIWMGLFRELTGPPPRSLGLPMCPIVSQLKPIYLIPNVCIHIRCNISVPSMSRSPNTSLPSSVWQQKRCMRLYFAPYIILPSVQYWLPKQHKKSTTHYEDSCL